ncbi:MAG: hypothetical protein Q8Q29_08140 [Actinomycetota bacterium]|nr:hypothetical protein [Actinomycetota bacterium]
MGVVDPTGHFRIVDWEFTIADRDGTLVMATPGVPEGFEPRLERVGPTGLRVVSGFLAGSEIDLAVDGTGRVTGGTAGGVIPVERLDSTPRVAPGGGLRAPVLELDPERDRLFEEGWAATAPGGTPVIEPYPLHSFVQWLSRRDEVIFHGSNRTDIEEFMPRRESMELDNDGGSGNLSAVYGTHDGLWAMFFAVIDRSSLRGSIRNGVGMYESAAGDRLDRYRFSVDQRSLIRRPFTPGMLYMFPRDRFERIPLYPQGPFGNEWACFDSVRPIGRLPVTPDDFPFLDQIGGHDDGDLIRLSELGDEIFSRLRDAAPIPGGFRLTFDHLDRLVRDEWIDLGRRFYPDVDRRVIDDATVEMTGPPAFIDTMRRRLADLHG